MASHNVKDIHPVCVDLTPSVCVYPLYYNRSFYLLDIDECDLGLDDCDDTRVADCININGSFSCTCKTGYTGTGRNGTCKGE